MTMRLLVLACCLGLVGCKAGPDYQRPAPPVSPALQSSQFLRAAPLDGAAPVARWWDDMGDPVLAGLIDKGLARAPQIAGLEARLRQARSNFGVSRAGLFPSVEASATQVNAGISGSGGVNVYSLGFDSKWEVDLWGGKRRGLEKSRAETQAAAAKLADAHVALSAEIARTYVALRTREASLVLIERRQALEAGIVSVADLRFARGSAPRQLVESARQHVRRTAAQQADTIAEITVLRDTLALLIGEAPGVLDGLAAGAVPLPPAEVHVGDPASMLARRPDVRAAENALIAANAEIGVNEARRWPSISLIGLIGMGGGSPQHMFDITRMTHIFLPRLTWNFLDFGKAVSRKRAAVAGRDAALADYQAGILAALQDAEGALARYGAARVGLAEAGGGVGSAATLTDLQNKRAVAGTVSQADAMEAACREIDAQLEELGKRGELTIAYVAIVKSLGLGWQAIAVRQDHGS